MFEELKNHVYKANMSLHEFGLAPFTWGNASGVDRPHEIIAIKPSGVPYNELTPEKIVLVSFDGTIIEGDLNPSSDTPTHIELYKSFPDISGVVHTHSQYATAFAQAGKPIKAYGTTHADFSFGDIPCARKLTEKEITEAYERNTGKVIAECFKKNNIDENAVPGVLVHSHGVFTWGNSPEKASENAAVLEIVAKMAFETELINNNVDRIDNYLLKKHYERKHGKNAYYGQNK